MKNPYYSGPKSDHFDGQRFFSPGLPLSDKSLLDVLRWRLRGTRAPWPKVVPGHSGLVPEASVSGLKITCIGHASLLIQVAGTNLLVDPVWSARASPSRWVGPQRRNPPAVALRDLPQIHAVLVTHNHYDHMDLATLKALWAEHRPLILTPLGNDTVLRRAVKKMEVSTGDWWDRFQLSTAVAATVVPAYHWSSRSLRDRRMALWGGFLLHTSGGGIYCAGDTAYPDGAIFKEIAQRCGSPLVAILPIGAYAPRWFMKTQHVNPEEALRIAADCGARHILGVHWGTFPLTDEPYDEPPRRLANTGQTPSATQVSAQAFRPGDSWQLPNAFA